MADSIIEQIAQDVLATLNNITTDNGYDYTVAFERSTVKENEEHLKGVIYQVDPDEDDQQPTGYEDWTQHFAAVVFVMPPEIDTTPFDTYNNAVSSSIHKELMKDPHRGGLASDTIIMPTSFLPTMNGTSGITANFKVKYRHKLDDPFTA